MTNRSALMASVRKMAYDPKHHQPIRTAIAGSGVGRTTWANWLAGLDPESIIGLERVLANYGYELQLVPKAEPSRDGHESHEDEMK